MIPKVASTHQPVRLSLKRYSPQLGELNECLVHAERTVRSLAKSRNKTRDAFWIDEATAEAYFIVAELVITSYEEIVAKYPDVDARFRFYRMSVGYGLKAYFAYRTLSTLGYLKAKGIETKHVSFQDGYIGKIDNSAMITFVLEEVTRTAMERKVLEFYLMGNTWENISEKTGLAEKKVKRVMRRIKRRLKQAQIAVE